MTDRKALLAAIAENPKDMTTRLVYADWLQENGGGDLDAATEEFIRVSCTSSRDTNVMPRAAYVWIKGNWKRLVPSVIRLHTPSRVFLSGRTDAEPFSMVKGRVAWFRIGLPGRTGKTYRCTVTFIFWKGFVSSVGYWSPFARDKLKDALLRDQPLVPPKCLGVPA